MLRASAGRLGVPLTWAGAIALGIEGLIVLRLLGPKTLLYEAFGAILMLRVGAHPYYGGEGVISRVGFRGIFIYSRFAVVIIRNPQNNIGNSLRPLIRFKQGVASKAETT